MQAFIDDSLGILLQCTAAGYFLFSQLCFHSHVFLVQHIDNAFDVACLKHLDGKAFPLAYRIAAANHFINQRRHVKHLCLQFLDFLMAFYPFNYFVSQEILALIYA